MWAPCPKINTPNMELVKEENWGDTNGVIGLVVIYKGRKIKYRGKWLLLTRTKKELVGFVQDVVGNKKFLTQFKDGHLKQMSTGSLVLLSSEYDVVKE